jgi:hypothetical protein
LSGCTIGSFSRRAQLHEWVSDPYTVGRTPWTRDQPVARPLQTHNKRTQTSTPLWTHDPSVRAGEDGSCPRQRGHCDRQVTDSLTQIKQISDELKHILTSNWRTNYLTYQWTHSRHCNRANSSFRHRESLIQQRDEERNSAVFLFTPSNIMKTIRSVSMKIGVLVHEFNVFTNWILVLIGINVWNLSYVHQAFLKERVHEEYVASDCSVASCLWCFQLRM